MVIKKWGRGRVVHFAVALLGTSALFAASSAIADDSMTMAAIDSGRGPIETVVVTGSRFNPEAAPAKARLETTQPQTIINKSYIEDSVAATSDYVTLLAIVPSLTGLSINGPGLSDGNVKNTLRGMPDGNFGISYDGIPFGDTNGPTHHSESYFPGSTIGSVDVDRGPGNAGTLGASTYGGTINLFSEPLTDDFHGKQTATVASWGTWNFNTNLQTGTFSALGYNTRVLANFQDSESAGYLTLQSTHHDNELVKVETEVAPGWVLTAFANRNGLTQIANDNNGATAAQVVTYGKNFALQNTNSALPTYAAYNPEYKLTDMDYLRLRGDVSSNFHIDEDAYTYAYINKTVTTTNITQTLDNILNNTGQGLGTKVAGVTHGTDIPGYTKLNAYRVWGNILRASYDYGIGSVTGQLRAGLWWEGSATERERYYFDVTLCNAGGPGSCNAFQSELMGTYADQKTSSGTVFNGVPGVGYHEHTGWNQYEPFLEVDIRPIPELTITPGIKYLSWEHTIAPTSLVKGKPPTVYGAAGNPASFTTTRTLPFATVNYKIEPNFSVYAQYANGMYVPDISAFEVNNKIDSFPKPQTTTNYQFGFVYYGDNFSADADIYYINSDNTIEQTTCNLLNPPGPASDTCNFNAGTVIYKGVEGETTYAFGDDAFNGVLDGLALFANGSINSAKAHTNPLNPLSPSFQDKQAPFWTAAGGLIYKSNGWKLSLIDKLTGQQYEDSPGKRLFVNGSEFYRLGAYNNMDFTGSYDLGAIGLGADIEVGGGVYNLLDSTKIVSITINDKAPLGGTSAQDITNRVSCGANKCSLDQYFFQPERSFQFTLKARF